MLDSSVNMPLNTKLPGSKIVTKKFSSVHMSPRDFMMTNSSQFLTDNPDANGRCFVTTKKVIVLGILALGLICATTAIMYFYGPRLNPNQGTEELEKLINDTLETQVNEEIKLHSFIRPLHYRLRIHPILDEGHKDQYTYTGRVTIVIQPIKKVTEITLNSENLQIKKSEVILTTPIVDTIKNMYELSNFNIEKRRNKRDLTNASDAQENPTIPQVVYPANISSTSKQGTITSSIQSNFSSNSQNTKISTSPSTTIFPESATPESSTLETNLTTSTTRTLPTTTNSPSKNGYNVNKLVTIKTILVHIKTTVIDENSSRITLKLRDNLEPGSNYTLDISFSGKITDDLKGFYRISYGNGKKKNVLVTTRANPIYARRIFPCFDQPDLKAPFEISIARKTNMVSLSNMPLVESDTMETSPQWVWDHFQKSPPLSPSSVSFMIFNYKKQTLSESSGPVIKVWAPESEIQYSTFALQSASRIIKFLQHYMDMDVPMNKIDFVSMPSFIKDTVQNWGLVQISEESLLLNEEAYGNSWAVRTRIFKAVAHGIAHQWFSNYVTMSWWSDVWLSEGISSYIATISEESLETQWDVFENFPLLNTQVLLTIDKLKTTHALKRSIKSLHNIRTVYDKITYQKGSCILRMLDFFLTSNSFQKGIQTFAQQFAFDTTNEEGLWNSFPIGPHVVLPNTNLSVAMKTWSEQAGIPVVTVIRDYNSSTAIISQEKFLEQNETDDTIWYIPLSYQTQNENEVTKMWLISREVSIDFKTTKQNEWIVFNIEQTGYYRVNYDLINWKLLTNQLQKDPSKITTADRAQLIDDAFQLAENGRLSYEIPMKLLKYLPTHELKYAPWGAAITNMDFLDTMLHNTKYNGMLQNYVTHLIEGVYSKLFPNNTVVDVESYDLNKKMLKQLILKAACQANYPPCLEWAINSFSKWMKSGGPQNMIPYHYRQIIYCTSIRLGGGEEWEFLWNTTRSKIAAGDESIAYLSLGCTRDPWLINRYLAHSLDDSIPLSYVPLIWKSISKSVGLHVGLKFLRLNWNQIYEKYGNVQEVLNTIVDEFLSNLSTKVDIEDLTTFFKANRENMKSVASLMMRTVDKIRLRIYWWEKNLSNITKWLSDKQL